MKSYFTIEQNNEVNKNIVKKISELDIEWQSGKESWIIKKGKFQDVSITIYKKGKVLLQGKDIEYFLELVGYRAASEKRIIGADESGKGDYFGPLVTAAVFVEDSARIEDLGIKDSKKLNDARIIELAKEIKDLCEVRVSVLMPEDYNKTYNEDKNLNILLAKEHVRNIKGLLSNSVNKIYIDQFAKNSNISSMLNSKTKVIEETKAEDKYIAVAAASIIARANFVLGLENLSEKIGMILPKGAYNVEDVGIKILKEYGFEGLKKVAKIHFKTTDKLLKII